MPSSPEQSFSASLSVSSQSSKTHNDDSSTKALKRRGSLLSLEVEEEPSPSLIDRNSIDTDQKSSDGPELSQLEFLTSAAMAASALQNVSQEISYSSSSSSSKKDCFKPSSSSFDRSIIPRSMSPASASSISLPPISRMLPEHFGAGTVRIFSASHNRNQPSAHQSVHQQSPGMAGLQNYSLGSDINNHNNYNNSQMLKSIRPYGPAMASSMRPVNYYYNAPAAVSNFKASQNYPVNHYPSTSSSTSSSTSTSTTGSLTHLPSLSNALRALSAATGSECSPSNRTYHSSSTGYPSHKIAKMVGNQHQYNLHNNPLVSSTTTTTAAASSTSHHPSVVRNHQDELFGNVSTLQAKMNFRNFSIQLGARSTNLTSNQTGSAASDKEHFAAVMQDSVVLTTTDFISAFPHYKPTVNNKLKPLKFIEFVQEQLYGHYSETNAERSSAFFQGIPPKDDLVFVYRTPDNVVSKNPSIPRYRAFRHARTISLAVYREGQRIFPVEAEDLDDFWMDIPKKQQAVKGKETVLEELKEGDLVMIARGYGCAASLQEADSIALKASKIAPGADLDSAIPPVAFDNIRGENGMILAVLDGEFDQYYMKDSKYKVRHVIHVEKNGHTAIDEPWPYAITKHTLVLRPYLALLYSDASKINRFSPTIEFLIRKVCQAPVGDSISDHLGKLSEIQHMAGGILVERDKMKFWATGGAFIIHLRRELKSPEWTISFPGINDAFAFNTTFANLPITETRVQEGDCVLLFCPEIKAAWRMDELVDLIQSRSLWPEKLEILGNRLKETKNSKNGIGFYEITLNNNN